MTSETSDRRFAIAGKPDDRQKPAATTPLLFVIQVWGRTYTALFIDAMLPSVVTPENFNTCGEDSLFLIYTTARDAETIRSSEIFRKLSGLVETRFDLIDATEMEDPYLKMSHCHRMAIAEAGRLRRPVIFLSPDTVLSRGALARLGSLASQGFEAVLLPGIRVTAETFLPALESAHPQGPAGERPIDSPSLVRLMVRHLHPLSSSLFWHAADASVSPSHLYWSVGRKGIVGLCAHIHPIMVKIANCSTEFVTTIDGDFLNSVVSSPERMHVVTDSDEMMVVEISSRTRFIHATSGHPTDVPTVARWMAKSTNAQHRRFLRETFLLHDGPVDADWRTAINECDTVRGEILNFLAAGSESPSTHDPAGLGPIRAPEASFITGARAWSNRVGRTVLAKIFEVYRFGQEASDRYGLCSDGPTRLHYAWLSYSRLKDCIDRRLPAGSGHLLVADGGALRPWICRLARQRGYEVTSLALRNGRGTDLTILEGVDLPRTRFDVIVCLDYLEYAFDPAQALGRLTGALATNGLLMCVSAFMTLRDPGAYDYNRFTTERITRSVESDIWVDSIETAGGPTSLLAQIGIGWPYRAMKSRRIGKVAIAMLWPLGLAWAGTLNSCLALFGQHDRTRQFYSHSLVTGRRLNSNP